MKTSEEIGDPTEVGELRGAALELELVAGEGLEPVLERVLQRPRYDRLHLPPRSQSAPEGYTGAARRGAAEVRFARCRWWRAAGSEVSEIPERWRKRRRGERRWGGEGCEKRWWALFGSETGTPFGLVSFFFSFFFLFPPPWCKKECYWDICNDLILYLGIYFGYRLRLV